jgi:hypothetical protein
MVESERSLGDKTSFERRYYLSSLPAEAAHLGERIRGHWGIESAPQAHREPEERRKKMM